MVGALIQEHKNLNHLLFITIIHLRCSFRVAPRAKCHTATESRSSPIMVETIITGVLFSTAAYTYMKKQSNVEDTSIFSRQRSLRDSANRKILASFFFLPMISERSTTLRLKGSNIKAKLKTWLCGRTCSNSVNSKISIPILFFSKPLWLRKKKSWPNYTK